MEAHHIHPELLRHKVRILVVGCGGNGSAIVAGLPYLHQALLVYGHPEGLHVTVLDPEVVSPTNCIRQPFSQSEIGLYKSVVLANRLNLFWGLDWEGIPERLDGKRKITGVDIVIGCVDTRPARVAIAECVEDWSEVDYWLDLGNNAKGGQFVLGVTSESKKPAEEASAAHGFGALPGSHPTGAGQRRPAELQRCGSSGAARALRKSDIGESRPCTAGSLVPVWGHFIPRSLHGSLIVTWSAAVAR